VLGAAIRRPAPMIVAAALLFAGALLLFLHLGQEFTPTLDEKNIVMEVRRIPSTGLSQSQSMQLDLERAISRFPQVAVVSSRTGTPDLAADPMPPNASDTYIMLKPQHEWPDPDLSKDELIRQIDAEATKLPGNKLGFSQPIQMRFNELIAGVRDDVAVKIFGDEFEPMLAVADRIAGILRRLDGAADVKVEEVVGLPFLDIRIDKTEIARRGLSLPPSRT
jgi:cobalt-zinc-cadmium resistance protein CzcA